MCSSCGISAQAGGHYPAGVEIEDLLEKSDVEDDGMTMAEFVAAGRRALGLPPEPSDQDQVSP